jgi:hypothetical protein
VRDYRFSPSCPVSFVKFHAAEVGWMFPAISQILARIGQPPVVIFHSLCDQTEHASCYSIKFNHCTDLDQIDSRELVSVAPNLFGAFSLFLATRRSSIKTLRLFSRLLRSLCFARKAPMARAELRRFDQLISFWLSSWCYSSPTYLGELVSMAVNAFPRGAFAGR